MYALLFFLSLNRFRPIIREAAERRSDRQPLSMRKGQVLPLMVSPSPSSATKWSMNDR